MSHKDYYINQISQDLLVRKSLRREAFLSLGNNDPDKIDFLLSISYDLTPLGFECFVAYFLELHEGFKTQVTGGYNDGGIDVKGIRKNENGEVEYAIVQCKRWNFVAIREPVIAAFYGRVADIRHANPNTQIYFATTSHMTGQARAFLNAKNITYLDFDTFLKAPDYVSRKGFMEYLNRHANDIVAHQNDKAQMRIFIETNRDAFELLKQVRAQIAREAHVKYLDIANDHQLCEIIRHHPESVNEFIGVGWFSAEHAAKYGQKFVEAISGF